MNTFRKAVLTDLPQAWSLVDAARNNMIAIGRKQWTRQYPNMEILARDIDEEAACILEDESGRILAYGAVYLNAEPVYDNIEGEWLSDGDYLVIHRLAVHPELERRGYASEFFRRVESMALSLDIHSVKVDTNYDNVGMLHILESRGYHFCGLVHFPVNGERRAFEKLL